MEMNSTCISAFSLLGLFEVPEMQPILFRLFQSMYLVTVLGNLLIILVVSSDSHLHTPMYFFLANLSLANICFIFTTVPKMLVNIQSKNRGISYIQCFMQLYFSNTFVGMDTLLLTIMVYDHFVAICHPLNNTVIMNPQLCSLLVLMSWTIILFTSLIHIILMSHLIFSISAEIPHFFCELFLLLKVPHNDTLTNTVLMYMTVAPFGVFPATGILCSYCQIISSLMSMSSTTSKHKAFSTCGSHLCVVSLFYGSAFGVYLSSSVICSFQGGMIALVMCTVVTPMLNPFIYSLRNKDVKGALVRLICRAVLDLHR